MPVPDYSTLRALAQQATPGPWFQGRPDKHYESVRDIYSEREPDDTSHDIATYIYSEADAAYIAAVSPTVLTTILDELGRLRRWKAEALEVITGLDEVGRALGCEPGERITGRATVDRALDLRNENTALAAQITAVRALLGEWEQDAATLPPAALNLIDDVRTALDVAQTGEPT